MKDNAGGDPGLILRRAAELRVDASDWKGADGDKRSGKLPAVEIQRGKSVAEARLVPPGRDAGGRSSRRTVRP